MTREVMVEDSDDGLTLKTSDSSEVTAREAASIINELADTYCTDRDCQSGKSTKCEVCKIGDKAFEIRKRLTQ